MLEFTSEKLAFTGEKLAFTGEKLAFTGEKLAFTIPLPPVTKKNHQEIHYKNNRPFIAQSKTYKSYETSCMVLIPGDCKKYINSPVNVKAVYFMPSRRRVDITNLHSALHDVLVKAGVLQDDSSLSPRIVVGTDGSRVMYDKLNPRTEVEITEEISGETCR